MKVFKIALIIVMLLFLGILIGCQDGYTSQNNLSKTKKVVLEPSATGFWYPKITYTDAN